MNCPTCGKEYTDEDAIKDETRKPDAREKMKEEAQRRGDDAVIAALGSGVKLEIISDDVFETTGLCYGNNVTLPLKRQIEGLYRQTGKEVKVEIIEIDKSKSIIDKDAEPQWDGVQKISPEMQEHLDKYYHSVCGLHPEAIGVPPSDPLQRKLWEMGTKNLVDYMYQDMPSSKLLNAHAIMQEHIEKYHPLDRSGRFECPRCHRFVRHLCKKDNNRLCALCFALEGL